MKMLAAHSTDLRCETALEGSGGTPLQQGEVTSADFFRRRNRGYDKLPVILAAAAVPGFRLMGARPNVALVLSLASVPPSRWQLPWPWLPSLLHLERPRPRLTNVKQAM